MVAKVGIKKDNQIYDTIRAAIRTLKKISNQPGGGKDYIFSLIARRKAIDKIKEAYNKGLRNRVKSRYSGEPLCDRMSRFREAGKWG
jgi:hypothetical protein